MKLLKKIIRVGILALFILALLFSALLFAPFLFGQRAFLISSKSMSPVINKGDLIYVKKIAPALLKKDDIITFYQANSKNIITHRIARIDQEKGLIYTIGDKNMSEDYEPIGYENLIGIYSDYKLPFFELFVKSER
jgi:signal peptidase I